MHYILVKSDIRPLEKHKETEKIYFIITFNFYLI